MIEVEILRQLWHEGRPVKAGQVIALDASTAAYLVGLGRAEYVAEAAHPARQEPAAKPQRRRAAKGAA